MTGSWVFPFRWFISSPMRPVSYTHLDVYKRQTLTREAFWNVYRPGCMEHYVLHCYRNDPAFVPELDLVMVLDGEMIGRCV